MHCQLTTGPSGSPVVGSHAVTDSRWFDTPTAATSDTPTVSATAVIDATTVRQMSAGSLSTQPGRGKVMATRSLCRATILPPRSIATTLVFVVP